MAESQEKKVYCQLSGPDPQYKAFPLTLPHVQPLWDTTLLRSLQANTLDLVIMAAWQKLKCQEVWGWLRNVPKEL